MLKEPPAAIARPQHGLRHSPLRALSVVLPVYDAMPYLTEAIRDVLRQEVEGGLELICAWDGGDVDAWEFLVEVAQRCGRVRGPTRRRRRRPQNRERTPGRPDLGAGPEPGRQRGAAPRRK